MPAIFIFQRGEPIIVDLVIDDAGAVDPATVDVAMVLKEGQRPPPQSEPSVADFDVLYVPASGGDKGYWRGTIPAAQAIEPGDYVTDAVLSIAGDTIAVTDPVRLQVRGSVTPP